MSLIFRRQTRRHNLAALVVTRPPKTSGLSRRRSRISGRRYACFPPTTTYRRGYLCNKGYPQPPARNVRPPTCTSTAYRELARSPAAQLDDLLRPLGLAARTIQQKHNLPALFGLASRFRSCPPSWLAWRAWFPRAADGPPPTVIATMTTNRGGARGASGWAAVVPQPAPGGATPVSGRLALGRWSMGCRK